MSICRENGGSNWSLAGKRRVQGCALPLTLAVLTLCGGAAPAYAVSGEDARTVALFTQGCFASEADVIAACFDGGDSGNPRCDLFSPQGTGGTLPTGLCETRSVMLDPELLSNESPIETNVTMNGSSHGYIRALGLQGESAPIHVLTQTFGDAVESVKISPATVGDGTVTPNPQCKIRVPADATERATFCADTAAALPILGGSSGDLRFVVTYDYKRDTDGASNFGTDRLMTVWACPGLDAQCVTGDPTQLVTRRAVLLNEDWLRLWLTNTGYRLLR